MEFIMLMVEITELEKAIQQQEEKIQEIVTVYNLGYSLLEDVRCGRKKMTLEDRTALVRKVNGLGLGYESAIRKLERLEAKLDELCVTKDLMRDGFLL